MRTSFVTLVSLCLSYGLAGCGPQAKDPIDCRLKIKLSGGLDGTFDYGAYFNSKTCSGTGSGDQFDIGLGRDDLPDMHIWVCGIGPGEIGDGVAHLTIQDGSNTWVSGDDFFDCDSAPCPVTITKNHLEQMEDPPFTGGEYWVEGKGHCDQPLVGSYGDPIDPIEVVGEFSFGGMPGLWE